VPWRSWRAAAARRTELVRDRRARAGGSVDAGIRYHFNSFVPSLGAGLSRSFSCKTSAICSPDGAAAGSARSWAPGRPWRCPGPRRPRNWRSVHVPVDPAAGRSWRAPLTAALWARRNRLRARSPYLPEPDSPTRAELFAGLRLEKSHAVHHLAAGKGHAQGCALTARPRSCVRPFAGRARRAARRP